jgi:cyanate permease
MNRFTSPGWRLAAIVLVGLNLRPALAAVGPLLDMIQRTTGISDGAASLLTTIPILLMGLGCARSTWRRSACSCSMAAAGKGDRLSRSGGWRR